jgi:hypothetical protein
MKSETNRRDSIESLDRECAGLLSRLVELVRTVPTQSLYEESLDSSAGSIGENVVRSAAILEQTFGGLTTNLWDDPHEWTLPETLSTSTSIIEYLREVDQARARAFASLVDDSALGKYIAMPSGEQLPIRGLLAKAIEAAQGFEQRAGQTYKPSVQ